MVVTVLCPLRGLRTAPAESCRGRHTLCLVMRPVSQLRCLRSETGSIPVRGARRMPRGEPEWTQSTEVHEHDRRSRAVHIGSTPTASAMTALYGTVSCTWRQARRWGNAPLRTLVAVHRLQSHGDQPSLQNSERGFDSLATCGIVVQRENAWPAPRRCEFESRRFHRPSRPTEGHRKTEPVCEERGT